MEKIEKLKKKLNTNNPRLKESIRKKIAILKGDKIVTK